MSLIPTLKITLNKDLDVAECTKIRAKIQKITGIAPAFNAASNVMSVSCTDALDATAKIKKIKGVASVERKHRL